MSIRRITIEVDEQKLSALQDDICAGEELSGMCIYMMPANEYPGRDREYWKRQMAKAGITVISDEVIG